MLTFRRALLFSGCALAAATLMALAAGQLGLLAGRRPADLGVKAGLLKEPSLTPNSVSSQAGLYPGHPQREYAFIAPLGKAASLQTVVPAVSAQPGCTVVTQTPDYLHAECQTQWMHFVDDLEIWLDPSSHAVHVRSASRLGRKDFGANRTRVDAIRDRLNRP